MSECTKCGAKFVGTPESMPPDGLCRYCQIDELKAEVERLRVELCQVSMDHGQLQTWHRQTESELAALKAENTTLINEQKAQSEKTHACLAAATGSAVSIHYREGGKFDSLTASTVRKLAANYAALKAELELLKCENTYTCHKCGLRAHVDEQPCPLCGARAELATERAAREQAVQRIALIEEANRNANAAIGDIANECKTYVQRAEQVEARVKEGLPRMYQLLDEHAALKLKLEAAKTVLEKFTAKTELSGNPVWGLEVSYMAQEALSQLNCVSDENKSAPLNAGTEVNAPESVEAHIRADRHLPPETRDALLKMIECAMDNGVPTQ